MKIFLEEQRITKPLVIIGLSIVFIAIVISIVYDWESISRTDGSDKIGTFISLAILPLVALLFLNLKLKTRIDEKGIHFQFYPIHFSYRTIAWDEISTCYVRQYNAILEYGGWGFRISFRKKIGSVYNVQGNIGLQIDLKNGKKILIGTQKKEDMQRVIDKYSNKITI
jgi:hypothetical protein